MKTSDFFKMSKKEIDSEIKNKSHVLMIKAGLIKQLCSGVYTWLPIGTIIINKIMKIIKNEINKINFQEIIMPCLQPAEIWKKTKRWENYGSELFKIQDRNKKLFCLGPTHEEVITEIVHDEIKSYKQFPVLLYQIQTKFRDEIRPKSGVIRSREFIMKDAYSFHLTKECLENSYNKIKKSYIKIFNILQIKFQIIKADNGDMGGNESEEFLAIIKNKNKKEEKIKKTIEIGHIFKLGNKYSNDMNALIKDKNSKMKELIMGCYGIGISRLVGTIIEQNNDKNGIIWPENTAPFQVIIIPINMEKSKLVKNETIEIYNKLKSHGIETILENRKKHITLILKEIDLIGIPHRIIIKKENILEKKIEYKNRKHNNNTLIDKEKVLEIIKNKIFN